MVLIIEGNKKVEYKAIIRTGNFTLEELYDLKKIPDEYYFEMVLIIEGHKKEDEVIDIDVLINEVDTLINKGSKTKQAVNEIAEKYHYSKNVLYNEYIKQK